MKMIHEGGPIGPIENYLPQLKTIFETRGVVLAYLYGSQATGKANALSDVDIAVLFPRAVDARGRFDRVLELMRELCGVFQRDDVNVLDLAEGAPLLNNNVRLHGRVIFCADERARIEFMIRTLQQYEDTEPMRQMQNFYLREKIKRGLFGKPIPIARAR
jgi:predicted nucleotidyltransferase